MHNKKQAFTLGEILIVIMIIGVVSMLTIPGMKIGTENKELVTGVKKAYSTAARASEMAERELGPCGLWARTRSEADIMDVYKKYLNIASYCGAASGCFTDKTIRFLNGNNDTNYNTGGGGYKLMTGDGMTWALDPLNAGGASSSTYGISGGDDNKVIATFLVDVNGQRGPNVWGKDIYRFALTKENGVIPAGAASTAGCTSTGNGVNCAAKVIAEGAIKYK